VTSTPAFRVYLEDAHAFLKGGDAPESERRAKAVSALVRAERDVTGVSDGTARHIRT
jgi:hypothetical protein